MDFEIESTNLDDSSNEKYIVRTFDEPEKLIEYLRAQIGQWNGTVAGQELLITLRKVSSETPTLGVSVNDKSQVRAVFGQQ